MAKQETNLHLPQKETLREAILRRVPLKNPQRSAQ